MGNIFDYIHWRGDLSFKVSPFNHIDSLVLCQLMYAELHGVVSEYNNVTTQISNVAREYVKKGLQNRNLGLLINDNTANLLEILGKSARFSNVKLFGYTNVIDIETEVQFAAMSALLPSGELCIIFRGTDDTLIGWKEDFNMSYMYPVPAQTLALNYVHTICSKIKRPTYIMGHSKGGNLAVYASALCDSKISKKIISVFDNDGPGFHPEVCQDNAFIRNSKRVISVIPESSVVGILMSKVNKPIYIESSEKSGIAQHDIFSWQLERTGCKIAKIQSPASVLSKKTVDTWLDNVNLADRKKFNDEFFNVLSVTNATTLTELTDNWIQSSVAVLKAMSELDKNTKDQIYKIILMLFHAVQVNLPSIKEFFSHETKKIK